MDCKYIILDNLMPIIFHGSLTHKEIANGRKVRSAGFVDLYYTSKGITANCYASSASLEVESMPDDAHIIERMINPQVLTLMDIDQRTCKNCEGTGNLSDSYSDNVYKCPICSGSGEGF